MLIWDRVSRACRGRSQVGCCRVKSDNRGSIAPASSNQPPPPPLIFLHNHHHHQSRLTHKQTHATAHYSLHHFILSTPSNPFLPNPALPCRPLRPKSGEAPTPPTLSPLRPIHHVLFLTTPRSRTTFANIHTTGTNFGTACATR